MVSGEPTSVFERMSGVPFVGQSIVVVGDKPGAALTLRLTNNLLYAVAIVATSQAITMQLKKAKSSVSQGVHAKQCDLSQNTACSSVERSSTCRALSKSIKTGRKPDQSVCPHVGATGKIRRLNYNLCISSLNPDRKRVRYRCLRGMQHAIQRVVPIEVTA
jgi:hypothetical protein